MIKRIKNEYELYPNRDIFFKILRDECFYFKVVHPEGYNEVNEQLLSPFSFIIDVGLKPYHFFPERVSNFFPEIVSIKENFIHEIFILSSFTFSNTEDFTKEDIDYFFNELEYIIKERESDFKGCSEYFLKKINYTRLKINNEIFKDIKEG